MEPSELNVQYQPGDHYVVVIEESNHYIHTFHKLRNQKKRYFSTPSPKECTKFMI